MEWKAFRFLMAIVCGVLVALVTVESQAQVEHQLLRRLVVFPLKVDASQPGALRDLRNGLNAEIVDEAWWQIREELTESRRFLVASKQFLTKSDAFQARGELLPADAILLGRLLDAHALVTTQVAEKSVTMQVYDGGNGMLLWVRTLPLHPSLTTADQLSGVVRRLIRDFVASIPYQGFHVVDPLIGKPIIEEREMLLGKVDIGTSSRASVGDPVQWLRMSSTNASPLFQGGARIAIFAEGRIVRIDQGVATVEILRVTNPADIREFALVRLPREMDRLRTEFLLSDNVRNTINVDIVSPEISPAEQFRRENRPLVTTLSWVSSLAAFLLLAF